MNDLTTMLWKEIAEFVGHRRSLRLFAIVGLAMGVLPALTFAHHHGGADFPAALVLRVTYVLFATAVMVAQTAPDLVLHERVGHTLDYLLTTRLPDAAIFGGQGAHGLRGRLRCCFAGHNGSITGCGLNRGSRIPLVVSCYGNGKDGGVWTNRRS